MNCAGSVEKDALEDQFSHENTITTAVIDFSDSYFITTVDIGSWQDVWDSRDLGDRRL
jgi:hypothetical protein